NSRVQPGCARRGDIQRSSLLKRSLCNQLYAQNVIHSSLIFPVPCSIKTEAAASFSIRWQVPQEALDRVQNLLWWVLEFLATATGFEPVTNVLLQWTLHFNSFSLNC